MNDRVHPSAKPAFPATKGQLYGATRPAFRPQPKPPRSRRNYCCRCCCWSLLLLLILIFLAAIAAAVVWVLYRPQRPSFYVSSLRLSTLSLTSSPASPQINSLINLSLSARNPNKKLAFYYDALSVSVSAAGVDLADGKLPAFTHGPKNTTTFSLVLTTGGPRKIDSVSAASLRSDLNKKGKLPLEIAVETHVKVKLGGLKSNKVGIRVSCSGIKAAVPRGRAKAQDAVDSNVRCKVKLRIKIWKWEV